MVFPGLKIDKRARFPSLPSRRGYGRGLNVAAIRRQELRGKCLIERHVHRRALGTARHCRMASAAEVVGIGQLEIGVPLGADRRASANAVV